MTLPRFTSAILAIVVAGAASVMLSAEPQPQGAGGKVDHSALVAVVHTDNPVKQLSIGDLRRILLGEMTRWPNGKLITIALRASGQPERDAVLQLICGMSDADFERYALHVAYRGETQSTVKSMDADMGVKRFVFNVPGALGFVRADEVDSSVSILSITGHVPDQPSFGLTLRAK